MAKRGHVAQTALALDGWWKGAGLPHLRMMSFRLVRVPCLPHTLAEGVVALCSMAMF